MNDIDTDNRLKKMMEDNPVVFFYVNIVNHLTKEQIEILIKKLIDKTSKNNGQILMDAVKKVDNARNKKIPESDKKYFKKTWEK